MDKMPEVMWHQGKFTIVSTSKKFYPGGELQGENVHFVKPDAFCESAGNNRCKEAN